MSGDLSFFSCGNFVLFSILNMGISLAARMIIGSWFLDECHGTRIYGMPAHGSVK